MQNGFIVQIAEGIVYRLHKVSLVEIIKDYGESQLLSKRPDCIDEEVRARVNLWIDAFTVLKWLTVIGLLVSGVAGWIALFVVCYLLFFNLFSYFYYHAWGSDHAIPPADFQRQRRRLVSFILAILFSFLGFAYLYSIQFAAHFKWPSDPNWLDGLFLSVFNSFTLTYEGFQPCGAIGRALLLAQVLNVFVFFTVLIGNSVPNLSDRS